MAAARSLKDKDSIEVVLHALHALACGGGGVGGSICQPQDYSETTLLFRIRSNVDRDLIIVLFTDVTRLPAKKTAVQKKHCIAKKKLQ